MADVGRLVVVLEEADVPAPVEAERGEPLAASAEQLGHLVAVEVARDEEAGVRLLVAVVHLLEAVAGDAEDPHAPLDRDDELGLPVAVEVVGDGPRELRDRAGDAAQELDRGALRAVDVEPVAADGEEFVAAVGVEVGDAHVAGARHLHLGAEGVRRAEVEGLLEDLARRGQLVHWRERVGRPHLVEGRERGGEGGLERRFERGDGGVEVGGAGVGEADAVARAVVAAEELGEEVDRVVELVAAQIEVGELEERLGGVGRGEVRAQMESRGVGRAALALVGVRREEGGVDDGDAVAGAAGVLAVRGEELLGDRDGAREVLLLVAVARLVEEGVRRPLDARALGFELRAGGPLAHGGLREAEPAGRGGGDEHRRSRGRARGEVAAHEPAHLHGEGGRARGDGVALQEVLAVLREGERALVAVVRVLVHRLVNDRAEVVREVRRGALEGGRIMGDDVGEDLGHRAAAEGQLSGEHEVEGDAERVDVRPRTDRSALAHRLLGRHVVRRAHDLAGHGELRAGGPVLREAEVGQDDAVLREHALRRRERGFRVVGLLRGGGLAARLHDDVVRLHVAVGDAVDVRVVEREGDVARDAGGGPQGEVAVDLHELVERVAGDELHRVERRALVHAEVEDLDDVLVVEPRDDVRLALEALEDAGVGDLGVRELERDLDAQVLVVRAVDGAEAARPELVEERVPAGEDAGARHRRRGRVGAGRVARGHRD